MKKKMYISYINILLSYVYVSEIVEELHLMETPTINKTNKYYVL